MTIAAPQARLLAFCRNEFAYYDAIPSVNANRIDPLDVLVTVAMNSFVNSAVKVRSVHQALAANCDPLLPMLPEEADLLELDRWRDSLRNLLHAAVQAQFVLIPVATKVLHRKRRFLIPMLDGVVIWHYLNTHEHSALLPGTQSKALAADVAMEALALFHADLVHSRDEIDTLCDWLEDQGFPLSPVRVLELLVWMEVEPAGYYR